MLKRFALFAIISASVIFINSINFTGCSSDPVSVAPSGVSFNRDIMPIFAQNCSFPGCHDAFDNEYRLNLTSWNSLMLYGSKSGAEVIPYNARWSHMVQHINRDTNVAPVSEPYMPKARPPYSNGQPLPPAQVALIMQWINEGAKNDEGQVAFGTIPNKAFITNQASDFICVVNLDNNFVTRYIDAGGRNNSTQPLDAPHVIIVDNAGQYFYVSLIAEGYLEKFNAWTYEKVSRMEAGLSPAHIVISDDGSYGYYSNFDATNTIKTIRRFNTQTMTVTDTITDFRLIQPHGLRLTHNGQYLVCATVKSEFLFVIKTSDNSIEDIAPIDPTVPPNGNGTQQFIPYQVAITPDDKYALISCQASNDVRIYDLENRQMLSQRITVGTKPLALEISPDGRWCYVPNRNSNSVSVIDVQTFSVVKTLPNVGAQPHKIDFTADGHYAYVTCESVSGNFVHHPPNQSIKPGTTAVIDVWAGHVKVKDIEMASFPAGISITPGRGN